MKTSQFHISKESQQGKINNCIQSVKNSALSEETKENFITSAEAIVNAINAQREHVYEALENFKFEAEYKHDSDASISKGGLPGDLISSVDAELAKIANEIKTVKAQDLTGPSNNKLSESVEEFNHFNDNIASMIGDIRLLLNKKEEALVEETGTEEEAPQEAPEEAPEEAPQKAPILTPEQEQAVVEATATEEAPLTVVKNDDQSEEHVTE